MSWSISRVLSRTIIHLGYMSPYTSSNLPGYSAGHTIVSLFGLAPDGVCRAVTCYQGRGALLPHPFTLTDGRTRRRFTFCCTFRRLAPPRRYLASYPMEPGLSSPLQAGQRLSDQLRVRTITDSVYGCTLALTVDFWGACCAAIGQYWYSWRGNNSG